MDGTVDCREGAFRTSIRTDGTVLDRRLRDGRVDREGSRPEMGRSDGRGGRVEMGRTDRIKL